MDISFLVKTLNEADKIVKTLSSIRAYCISSEYKTEVIVLDAGSSDDTVALALAAGANVYQLATAEKGCGRTLQAAYQQSQGSYLYVIDGDMELNPQFVEAALNALQQNPQLAACGGLIVERQLCNEFDHKRREASLTQQADVYVTHLNGGGLYRRSAIDSAGAYLADPNLYAFEEAELGMRLRAQGYRLLKKNQIAVWHTGHSDNTLTVMLRHLVTGRSNSAGMLLKLAISKPWRTEAIRHLMRPLLVLAGWCTSLLFALLLDDYRLLTGWTMSLLFFPVLTLCKYQRKIGGLVSLLDWHFLALGIVFGILNKVIPAQQAIRINKK